MPRRNGPIRPGVAALAPPALGSAIELLIELGSKKKPNYFAHPLGERPVVQSQLAQAEAMVGAARAYLYESLDEAHESALEGHLINEQQKIKMHLATSYAIRSSADAVDLVCREAGTTAIRETSALGVRATENSTPTSCGRKCSRTQDVDKKSAIFVLWDRLLARISHRLTGQAHERPAITSLRLLAVLNGLSEYASLIQLGSSSGTRLVLTGLSCTLPRHPMRNAGLRSISAMCRSLPSTPTRPRRGMSRWAS